MALQKEFLEPFGVLPVITIDSVDHAVPAAEALYKGGIKAVEITLRTDCALDAIKIIKQQCPHLIVGAGTVVNERNVEQVVDAGVDFAVSPGLTVNLLKKAEELKLDLLPGTASPSEVLLGMEFGLSVFKLFPAVAVGGLPLLKSMGGPLPQVSFCPTGGLTVEDFDQYLALPNVVCVGGSWLLPKAAVQAGDWQQITDIAAKTMAKVSSR